MYISISSYTYTYRYIHIHINIYIHTSSTATTTTTHTTGGGVLYRSITISLLPQLLPPPPPLPPPPRPHYPHHGGGGTMGGGEALETKESQQHQKQAEPHHSPTTTGGGDHDPSTGGGGVGDAAPYISKELHGFNGRENRIWKSRGGCEDHVMDSTTNVCLVCTQGCLVVLFWTKENLKRFVVASPLCDQPWWVWSIGRLESNCDMPFALSSFPMVVCSMPVYPCISSYISQFHTDKACIRQEIPDHPGVWHHHMGYEWHSRWKGGIWAKS